MPASLDEIFRPILRSAAFERILEAAREGGPPVSLSGLIESSKALFLLLLRRELARPIALVTADDGAMEAWRRDLAAYAHIVDPAGRLGRVCRFPALDADPYLGLPPHLQVSCERVTTLQRVGAGEAGLVVAPARALIYPLPRPEEFEGLTLRLARGQEIPLEGLLRRLVDLGYRSVDVVSNAGDFARRGGILDVFPPAEESPVRLEFTGDEIESLRSFEPDSQRSIAPLDEITIAPTAEVPMTPARRELLSRNAAARATARFAGTGDGAAAEVATARWQSLLTGGAFQGIEGCAGLALEQRSDLFAHLGIQVKLPGENPAGRPAVAHLPGGEFVLVVDEPDRTDEELDSVYAELNSSREATAGPLPRPEELFSDPKRIRAGLVHARARLAELRVGERPDEVAVTCQPTRNYAGRMPEWKRDIVRHRAEGRRAVLLLNTLGTLERTAELLAEDGIPWTVLGPEAADVHLPGQPEAAAATGSTTGDPVFLMLGHLNHGFVLPDLGLALHAERELFGEEPRPQSKRRKRRSAAFISDFRDLHIGDAVVHVDHGIGRYEGLHRVGGSTQRDFMQISYEGGGRLFVPVDRLDLVQKYSAGGAGLADAPVKLDRLGGTGWVKRRNRVKKAVAEMTQELLDLYARRKIAAGHPFGPDTPWQREFEDAFPYTPTPDQERSIAEVKEDMESSRAMERLLCGDVGFGKTEVAMRAAFKAVQEGFQVAILCPTTVLALQHLNTFRARFAAFPVRIDMVSRFRTPPEVRETLARVEAGQVDVLIGTHRLLSKDVKFQRLGLLIVDEEQRFGVAHKERLKQLSRGIDTLTLTATPIPRTLQMSLAGVRDMSVIETPPQNRLAIQTTLVPYKKGIIAAAIRNEMRRGGQVFFVHNRVETLPLFAARLREVVPEARILIGHGQMDQTGLEDVMMKFMAGEADILCATTIIENGLDLPRVNTLFVNRADQFGLAQLYQLRGRIGRSDVRAYAYFIIPGREALSPPARRRLLALQEFSELGSGFRLAAMDLEIRGAGELLGARQHGHIEALGFDLYVQMLERAVREMQGEELPDAPPAQINLGVDIRLPEPYVPEPSMRLAFYKRVSSAEDEAELADLKAEMADRFGPLPGQAENLFALSALRLDAMKLGIKSLEFAETKPPAPPPAPSAPGARRAGRFPHAAPPVRGALVPPDRAERPSVAFPAGSKFRQGADAGASGAAPPKPAAAPQPATLAIQFNEPSKLDPAKLLGYVAKRSPVVTLTPAGVLRIGVSLAGDRIEAARRALADLATGAS